MADRPLPPQPATGQSCTSHAAEISRPVPAAGWRWYRALGSWVAVCEAHSGGPRTFRVGDYVPDWANVERSPIEQEAQHG